MNYEVQEYYDELYRIFANTDSLLTQTQLVLLGDCLRSLAAGENITYKLNNLHHAVEGIKHIAEPLETFMHSYIQYAEENNLEEDSIIEVEDTDYEKTYQRT